MERRIQPVVLEQLPPGAYRHGTPSYCSLFSSAHVCQHRYNVCGRFDNHSRNMFMHVQIVTIAATIACRPSCTSFASKEDSKARSRAVFTQKVLFTAQESQGCGSACPR